MHLFKWCNEHKQLLEEEFQRRKLDYTWAEDTIFLKDFAIGGDIIPDMKKTVLDLAEKYSDFFHWLQEAIRSVKEEPEYSDIEVKAKYFTLNLKAIKEDRISFFALNEALKTIQKVLQTKALKILSEDFRVEGDFIHTFSGVAKVEYPRIFDYCPKKDAVESPSRIVLEVLKEHGL